MHSFIAAALIAVAQGALAAPEPQGTSPSPSPEEQEKKLEEDIAKELGAQPGAARRRRAASRAAAPRRAPAPGAQPATGGNPYARILMLPDISRDRRASPARTTASTWAALSPRERPLRRPGRADAALPGAGARAAVGDRPLRARRHLHLLLAGRCRRRGGVPHHARPAGRLPGPGRQVLRPFGRLNQQHPHVWDFVDAPLALDRLLSADSLKGPGLDVAWLAPLPWFVELHLAGQTAQPSFVEEDRRTLVARLQQFFDVGEGDHRRRRPLGRAHPGAARRGEPRGRRRRPVCSRSAPRHALVRGVPGRALHPAHVRDRGGGQRRPARYLQAVYPRRPVLRLWATRRARAGGRARRRRSAQPAAGPSGVSARWRSGSRASSSGSGCRSPGTTSPDGHDGFEGSLHSSSSSAPTARTRSRRRP